MRRTRQYYIYRSVLFSSLSYVIIITLMAFNALYTPIVEEEEGIYIELEDIVPKLIDLNSIPEEKLSSSDKRNIAVNRAMQSQSETDPYDYSEIDEADDSYKEQLVKDAISEDEYKKIFERDDWNLEEDKPKEIKTKKVTDKQNKPSNYQGSTYISFYMKGRNKMKIPVPTYQCETSGTVTVEIVVNQDGRVISYQISSNSSVDECLRNAAINSVKKSRFNQNYTAPSRQRGSITYTFEAQ